MLIDCSYFTAGPRHIQNVSTGKLPNANAIEVNEAVTAFICEHQERFLTRMLGRAVGNRVNAYLVCLDEDEEPKRNDTMDAVCAHLKESFADYVFFHILRDCNEQSTVTGLVRLKTANTYVAPIRRQASVWNTMVERNRTFAEWCRSEECGLSGISVSEAMLTCINSMNL